MLINSSLGKLIAGAVIFCTVPVSGDKDFIKDGIIPISSKGINGGGGGGKNSCALTSVNLGIVKFNSSSKLNSLRNSGLASVCTLLSIVSNAVSNVFGFSSIVLVVSLNVVNVFSIVLEVVSENSLTLFINDS